VSASLTLESFALALGSVEVRYSMLNPSRWSLFLSFLNFVHPEDSQGTGNAFGFGKEVEAPSRSPLYPSLPHPNSIFLVAPLPSAAVTSPSFWLQHSRCFLALGA
jgi:hypothetical protein